MTVYSFSVRRSGDQAVPCSVAWALEGTGISPITGASFAGGVLPSGVADFSADELEQSCSFELTATARPLLEQTGQLDNTIIVFTSDHGYFYGEHGLNEERRLAYEETIRIPLLVRYPPRVKAGATASEMVLTIDLAPTLMEFAGLAPLTGMEGRSLMPIFTGTEKTWRDSFLVEYYSDTVFPRILKMGYSAVRTRDAKYIEYRDLTGMNELYDLNADPYEEHNLITAPTSAPLLKKMQGELQRLTKR